MCHFTALTISEAMLHLFDGLLRPRVRPLPFVHGCLDSPEAPTIVLMCVGSTGLALGSTIYRETGKISAHCHALLTKFVAKAAQARRL